MPLYSSGLIQNIINYRGGLGAKLKFCGQSIQGVPELLKALLFYYFVSCLKNCVGPIIDFFSSGIRHCFFSKDLLALVLLLLCPYWVSIVSICPAVFFWQPPEVQYISGSLLSLLLLLLLTKNISIHRLHTCCFFRCWVFPEYGYARYRLFFCSRRHVPAKGLLKDSVRKNNSIFVTFLRP